MGLFTSHYTLVRKLRGWHEEVADLSAMSWGSQWQVHDVAQKSMTSPRQFCREVNDKSSTSHVVSCCVAIIWIGLRQQSNDNVGIQCVNVLSCCLLLGDNLLAVVRAIVDSPLLADPAEYRHGHVIYFDFVGLFMVIMPVRLGMLVSVTVVILMLLQFAYKLLKSGHGKCLQFLSL